MTPNAKKLTDFVLDKLQKEHPELLSTFKPYLSYPTIDEASIHVMPLDGYIKEYNEFKLFIEQAESLFRSIPE